MVDGKERCRVLKQVRADIAKEYGIEGFEFEECPYEGPCSGTCPACEAELARLTGEVRIKILKDADKKRKNSFWNKLRGNKNEFAKQGVIVPPREYLNAADKIRIRCENAVRDLEPPVLMGMMIDPLDSADSAEQEDDTLLMGKVSKPEDKEDKQRDKVDDCFGIIENDESKNIWDK